MKTTSSMGYYLTLKCIFAFCDILQEDLKKGRNFVLVWNLDEASHIT